MSASILARIGEAKQKEIASGKARISLAEMESRAKESPPVRSFSGALAASIAEKNLAIIAEFKRASPSKGLIHENANPAEIASAYAENGATCLSVLTDREFFQATPDDLPQARAVSNLPVLRKDFFYDVWQVMEARAMGADAILIIMAAVSISQAGELADAAESLSMDVLVETHNEAELEAALALPERVLLGVNNRNLNNFETKLEVSERLSAYIPAGRVAVAESGIGTAADIARLKKAGFGAFLVGERLMRAADTGKALSALMEVPA